MESLLLGVIGGAAGLVLAGAALPLMTRLVLPSLPEGITIRLETVPVVFTIVVSLAAGAILSLLPLWSTRSLAAPLRERSGGRGVLRARVRRLLIVGQFATAVVLLAAMGLILKSVIALARVDPGFAPDRLLAVSVTLPDERYPSARDRQRFYQSVIDNLLTVGRVTAASASDFLPLEGGWRKPVHPAGEPPAAPGQERQAYSKPVMPGFFTTMGIPIIAGRDITAADVRRGAPVIIVDEAAARQFWPGANPIGRGVRHAIDGPELTVVGVVGSVSHGPLTDGFLPGTYHPYPARNDLQIVVRAAGSPESLVPDLRRVLRDIDPALPIGRVRTGDLLIARAMDPWRVDLALVSLFAGLALTLAAVGVYGVVSSVVAERSREIGIRLALGATRDRVRREVVGDAVRIAALGLALGAPVAVVVGRLAAFRRFEVTATDPGTFAAVAALLLVVAALASYVPARRAARLDPTITLRGE
jgi:predicted permease